MSESSEKGAQVMKPQVLASNCILTSPPSVSSRECETNVKKHHVNDLFCNLTPMTETHSN